METGAGTRARTAGIGWPLVGSAAGHLALLACLLLYRAAAAPNIPGIIQVLLVEGATADASAQGKSLSAAAGGARRAPGARFAPERVLPPAPDAAPIPPSPAAPAGLPVAPPAGAVPDPPPATRAVQPFSGALAQPDGEAPVPATAGTAGKALEALPGDVKLPGGAGPAASGAIGGKGSPRATPLGRSPRWMPLTVVPPGGTGAGGGGGQEGTEIRLLRERIESRIVYPAEAVRRGQEGEVLLRIRVGEGGIPKDIRVARSSGARALDEAARNGVVRAAPLPSIPGWFEVPVRFHLR